MLIIGALSIIIGTPLSIMGELEALYDKEKAFIIILSGIIIIFIHIIIGWVNGFKFIIISDEKFEEQYIKKD